jgi:hypothetical protein
MFGAGLHLGIIAAIPGTYTGLMNIIVMNLALVALYPAFWVPISPAWRSDMSPDQPVEVSGYADDLTGRRA